MNGNLTNTKKHVPGQNATASSAAVTTSKNDLVLVKMRRKKHKKANTTSYL